jgi:hypothetical protein
MVTEQMPCGTTTGEVAGPGVLDENNVTGVVPVIPPVSTSPLVTVPLVVG